MDFEVSYSLDNEQQFWDELQEIVSAQCDSESLIDNALRTYLSLTSKYKDEYLTSEYDVSRCSYQLFSSNIFATHADYVRRQIIHSLLQEDDPDTLHLIVSFLLFDGRQNEVTFHMMNKEGSFPRLLELIQSQKSDDRNDGAGLHRLLMELLYEMSRIQRVKIEDLVLVDDDFVKYLFEIIEELSYDASDPYHYPVIRILLVLNEQFMVAAHDPLQENPSSTPPTNKVIKILSMYGNVYKTFGENIILLLNREGETSLQLLTLKLLYLIFTTPPTYEYFYTNDLRVLVDILIRNLLDLPEEASALRHTYLRVLYPLLAHTQLKYPPHYKRDEVRRMLGILVHGQFQGGAEDCEKILHFNDVDETTKRLVARCASVEWLQDLEKEAEKEAKKEPEKEPEVPSEELKEEVSVTGDDTVQCQSPVTIVPEPEQPGENRNSVSTTATTSSLDSSSGTTVVEGTSSQTSSNLDLKQAESLGMHLEPARSSSLSVLEIAVHQEKPGVMTPSRRDTPAASDKPADTAAPVKLKTKPEPPKTRRWRGRRSREEDEGGSKIGEPLGTTRSASVGRRGSCDSLAPPVPPHARRSASRPPPAVPPPRRSSHPVNHHPPSHCSSPATPTTPGSPHRHGQKPEPPKSRRWKQLHPEPGTEEHHVQTEIQTPKEAVAAVSVQQPEEPQKETIATVSVQPESESESHNHTGSTGSLQEAMENVSLGG